MKAKTPDEVRQILFEAREKEKCSKKHKYMSESAATMRAEYYDVYGVHTRGKARSRAYKCPWCTYWHLTLNGRAS